MVWLNMLEEDGYALYFDIYHTERNSGCGHPGYSFSGVLGDGHFEGEVQIEIGRFASVTFADEWLNPAPLAAFFQRSPRRQVEAALLDLCRMLATQAECEVQPPPRRHRRAAQQHLVQPDVADGLAFA